jgi:hypothetical protein
MKPNQAVSVYDPSTYQLSSRHIILQIQLNGGSYTMKLVGDFGECISAVQEDLQFSFITMLFWRNDGTWRSV